MKVVACVAQLPDPAVAAAPEPLAGSLPGEGAAVLDPAGGGAVEAALRLVEGEGGTVVVVATAGPRAAAGVRRALAMGASAAVLVADDALEGADSLGTAKVLAAAVRREAPDLVVAATDFAGGSTETIAAQLAELLGLPNVAFARRLEIVGGRVRAERQSGAGVDEVECPLPAVVTMAPGATEPRLPSFHGIVAARTRPLRRASLADLALDPAMVVAAGTQEVVAVTSLEGRVREVLEDDGEAEERIVELLERLDLL